MANTAPLLRRNSRRSSNTVTAGTLAPNRLLVKQSIGQRSRSASAADPRWSQPTTMATANTIATTINNAITTPATPGRCSHDVGSAATSVSST